MKPEKGTGSRGFCVERSIFSIRDTVRKTRILGGLEVVERINKIEKDVVLISHSQKSIESALADISETLKEISKANIQAALTAQKVEVVHHETADAFKRVHERIDRLDTTLGWFWKTLIGAMAAGAVSMLIYLSKGT